MSALRARVGKGRLVLEEATTLPEGAVVNLVADDEGDDLTSGEQRAFARSAFGILEIRRGRSSPADGGNSRRAPSGGGEVTGPNLFPTENVIRRERL